MAALSRYADDVIDALSEREQAAAQRIFTRLVTPGTVDYAQPVKIDQFAPEDLELARTLGDHRLVVFGPDTIEVAHEALLRGWERLQLWLSRDSEVLALVTTVQNYKNEWERNNRDPMMLLPGPLLENAFRLVEEHSRHAIPLADYIVESMEVTRAEQRRQDRLQAQHDAMRLAALSDLARLSATEAPVVALELGIRSLLSMPLLQGDAAVRLALATTKPEHRLSLPDAVRQVIYSQDGGSLAAVGFDGTVQIWDAASGEPRLSLPHPLAVSSIAFSPAGALVATAGGDRTARLWDAGTATELARLVHGDVVRELAFNPAGTLLATASADATAQVWDVATAELVARLAHDDWVGVVAFSRDGQHLATASRASGPGSGRSPRRATGRWPGSGTATPSGRSSSARTARRWRPRARTPRPGSGGSATDARCAGSSTRRSCGASASARTAIAWCPAAGTTPPGSGPSPPAPW
ncbi:hypothetical protein GCM10010160_42190 [Acrocarpospora corrugata]